MLAQHFLDGKRSAISIECSINFKFRLRAVKGNARRRELGQGEVKQLPVDIVECKYLTLRIYLHKAHDFYVSAKGEHLRSLTTTFVAFEPIVNKGSRRKLEFRSFTHCPD